VGSALDAVRKRRRKPTQQTQKEKKARVLDSGLENMSESWSSLITGQQRCKAKLINNQQPISVGV
jgi:hypothetical protein